MSTEARCECCDLPAYSCGKTADHKQRQQNAADRELLLSRGWREASFVGHCARCGEAFPIGDVIIYYRDGKGRAVLRGCLVTATGQPRYVLGIDSAGDG
ncbi:MAG: hypothetical protein ACRDTH_25885 [Pseudonocardiaceae bacterium]